MLTAVAFLGYLFVQVRWFPFLSRNNDEAVYLFQAEMLRDGRLTLANADIGLSFRPWMSGTIGDRVVMVFPPGWPAVLAIGMTLLGSFKVVGALAAAFAVAATYLFAAEALDDRPSALVAGAFVGLSPLLVVLGGTVLSYPFALGVGALLGTAVLRAVRLGSRRWVASAGAAAGLLFSMRPLDALLLSTAFGLYLAWSWRRRLADVVGGAVWALAGAAPFVAAVLATNAHVTGSPLRFPLQANGGDNRMGFGPRRISVGARAFDATPEAMQEVTWGLIGELPRWTLGGLVVAPLVGWGVVRLWRRRPALVPLLVGLAIAFPVAYLFYWGSYFVHVGRGDYGPFYYLPMLVPVGVAVGAGLRALASRSRVAALVVVAVLLGMLPASLAPKAERAHRHEVAVRKEVRLVEALPRPSLVILPGSIDGPWMLHVRGYFRNPPDLESDRLFAADIAGGNLDLFDRFPRHGIYQLSGVLPGDSVEGEPEPVVERLRKVEATALRFDATFENDTDNPTVVAYLGVPSGFVRCVLDEESARGRTYAASWTVTADAVTPPPGCAPLPPVHVAGRPLDGNLVAGFSASATVELEGVNRWEHVYVLRPGAPPAIAVPGVPRRTSAGDLGDPRADYPGQVDHVLSIEVQPVDAPEPGGG